MPSVSGHCKCGVTLNVDGLETEEPSPADIAEWAIGIAATGLLVYYLAKHFTN